MQKQDWRDRVRQFVVTNFYVSDPAGLDEEASLLQAGIIDSTGLLEIIAFLETSCGLKVADDEILPENLDGIGRIIDYVVRKTAGNADRAA